MTTQHIVHEIMTPGLDGDGFTAPEAAQVRSDLDTHETAILRVDPGTTGSVGDILTIGPSGPTWVKDTMYNVKHPSFGAVGDGVTDDTAAIQAAINAAMATGGVVYFPTGPYRVNGTLTVSGMGITLRGASRRRTYIEKPNAGTLFNLDGVSFFAVESMYIATTAGHMFDSLKTIFHARFEDLMLKQYSLNHSIFHLDDTISGRPQADYVDNLWYRVESVHELAATVPTFFIRSYAANRNRFIDCRPHYSGNYHWWVETSHQAGAAAIGNVWEGITGEVLNGGGIMLRGCMGTRIADFDFWDFSATIHKHLIAIEQSDTNGTKYSSLTTIENTRRVSGTLGGGIWDVYIGDGDGGGNTHTTLIGCGGYSATPMKVRDRGAVIQIGGNVEYELWTATIITGRNIGVHGTIRPRTYTTANRPAANSVSAGSMIYDTTLGKPIWSDNANWRDAAGTIV